MTAPAIETEKLGKCYRRYRSATHKALELATCGAFRGHEEFWALSDVDLAHELLGGAVARHCQRCLRFGGLGVRGRVRVWDELALRGDQEEDGHSDAQDEQDRRDERGANLLAPCVLVHDFALG